jgi:hypothetical protein
MGVRTRNPPFECGATCGYIDFLGARLANVHECAAIFLFT